MDSATLSKLVLQMLFKIPLLYKLLPQATVQIHIGQVLEKKNLVLTVFDKFVAHLHSSVPLRTCRRHFSHVVEPVFSSKHKKNLVISGSHLN